MLGTAVTSIMRLSLLTVLCVILEACSTQQPAKSAAAAKAAAPVSAPAAPVAAGPGPGAAGAPATDPAAAAAAKPAIKVLEDKTLTNDEVRQLLAQNYRPLSRDGQIYYCRREQHLGSRFTSLTCRTADEMKEIARESKDMAAAKQKSSGCASQGPAC